MLTIVDVWEWSEAKRESNLTKHGIDLFDIAKIDWPRVNVELDDRRNYGELRFVATGPIDGVLHVAVYAFRGEHARLISLRRANRREESRYADAARETGLDSPGRVG